MQVQRSAAQGFFIIMLIRIAPWLFVVLWSTGYIAMKAAVPYAEPMTFLGIRFALVAVIMVLCAAWLRPDRLPLADWLRAGVVGVCLHAVYLGGIMIAIDRGVPAGVAALIIAFQPLLMALCAGPVLGETVRPQHWAGLICGLAGLALVLMPKFGQPAAWAQDLPALAAAVVSVLALTFGTLYQKAKASHIDVRAGLLPQFAGAAFVSGLWAWAFETRVVAWTPELIGALAWLVVVLSIGAISLFLMLLRENAAWRTSALFYLIPSVAAVTAWAMFGEQLSWLQFGGMVLVMAAVIVVRPGSRAR